LAGFDPSLCDSRRLVFQYQPSRTKVAEILEALRRAPVEIVDVSTEEADLEDIFLRLTTSPPAAG
jgi:ABC-2 type transport system ATP-binding protein